MPYRLVPFGNEENIGPELIYEARTICCSKLVPYELNLLVATWKQIDYLVEKCGFSIEGLLEAALEDNADRDLLFPISLEMQNTIAYVYGSWMEEYGHQGPLN